LLADQVKKPTLNVIPYDDSLSGVSWRIKDLIFDPTTRRLSRAGQTIRLSVLSMDVLQALIAAAPEPVSAQGLIDSAWDGAVVSDETVTQRIKLLRQALGDDGRNPDYIETVRNRGYRLVPVPVGNSKASRRGYLYSMFLMTLLLLAGAWGWYYFAVKQPIELTRHISGTTSAEDYIQQATEYLNRHQQADNGLAITLFRQALALQPDNLQATTGLSMALTQSVTKFNATAQRLDEAQALAKQAVAKYPQQHNSWLALAASLDGQGSVALAIEAYQQALTISPEHIGAKASVAYLYQIRGELVKALRLNLEVFDSAEQLHYLHLQIAQVLSLLGFDPAAEPWLERTDELQPDNVFAAESRAHFLLVNHRFDEAEQVLKAALSRGVQRAELWLKLGLIYLINGRFSVAEDSFNQALQVEPERTLAQTWKTIMIALQGELDEELYQHELNTIHAQIAAGNSWPDIYLLLASLQAAYGDDAAALDTIELLFSAGFRDYRALALWPTFSSLLSDQRFQTVINQMQQDITNQRDAVLRADWVPRQLLFAQPTPTVVHNQ